MHVNQPSASVTHAPRSFGSSNNHVTLILDIHGCIRSCGMRAETLLGHSHSALYGRPLSQFIAGFALTQVSASYRARYFAHLCAQRSWHPFNLVNNTDQGSAVDLSFSRITTVSGRDIIFLKMRPHSEPGTGSTAPISALEAFPS